MDERDDLDRAYTECWACGDEIAAGFMVGGHPVCYRCRYSDVEVQATLEADRQADVDAEFAEMERMVNER